MVHPYNEIPLGNNKEQTTDMHNGINESQKHYAEWKKPITKEYMMSDATFKVFWNKENLSVVMEKSDRWLPETR